jgi:6-phosphogluconolactonase
MPAVEVLPSLQDVAEWAANALACDIEHAINASGSAVWVAAGGSTPAAAYSILGSHYASLPWREVRILMGDERCVAPDDPDSNWRQLDQRLLSHLDLPLAMMLRPPAELGAEAAADHYDHLLRRLATDASGRPRLDHVWLGIGEDGHTLSLFPHHAAAAIPDRLAVAVHDSPKPPPDRVTLTYKALEGAVHCVILATGEGKKEAVRRAIDGDEELPVAHAASVVETAGGHVTWVLDAAAAGPLSA